MNFYIYRRPPFPPSPVNSHLLYATENLTAMSQYESCKTAEIKTTSSSPTMDIDMHDAELHDNAKTFTIP
jgi:hypothetical protein